MKMIDSKTYELLLREKVYEIAKRLFGEYRVNGEIFRILFHAGQIAFDILRFMLNVEIRFTIGSIKIDEMVYCGIDWDQNADYATNMNRFEQSVEDSICDILEKYTFKVTDYVDLTS